jgi:hypothetical protein
MLGGSDFWLCLGGAAEVCVGAGEKAENMGGSGIGGGGSRKSCIDLCCQTILGRFVIHSSRSMRVWVPLAVRLSTWRFMVESSRVRVSILWPMTPWVFCIDFRRTRISAVLSSETGEGCGMVVPGFVARVVGVGPGGRARFSVVPDGFLVDSACSKSWS